jgi:hypothetical protein
MGGMMEMGRVYIFTPIDAGRRLCFVIITGIVSLNLRGLLLRSGVGIDVGS